MTEFSIGLMASLTVLGMVLSCFFYMWGGRSGKWKRRFIGSFILALTVNLASYAMDNWNPWFLIIWPILIIAFSKGYGGEILSEKLIRRTIYCLGVVSAALPFCIILGGQTWFILIPHAGLGAWSIYLGIKNPVHAAAEEVFVCGVLNFGLCMYPFTT